NRLEQIIMMKKTRRNRLTRRSSQLQKRVVARYLAKLSRSAARPLPASQWRKTTMTPPVDYSDKRYFQLVDWLANEPKMLSQALRREPTGEEHRAPAHAFVDLVFDDQAKAGAAWVAAAATKIVRLVPPVRPRDPWIN